MKKKGWQGIKQVDKIIRLTLEYLMHKHAGRLTDRKPTGLKRPTGGMTGLILHRVVYGHITVTGLNTTL